MRTEFRVVFTMTFNTEADRNTAYDKIKTVLVNAKATFPVHREAHLVKDDYQVNDQIAEVF